MASFPTLKTSAVAQYPATRQVSFHNQVLRFVDGTEQRYRDSAGPRYQWQIRLDKLDESELAAVENFVEANEGVLESFSFTDPWSGQVYANCSLSSDVVTLFSLEEMCGRVTIMIEENRA